MKLLDPRVRGIFIVIAKLHRVPRLDTVLNSLSKSNAQQTQTHQYYSLNDEVFLFSAGNIGDLQHIFLAETLHFGVRKKGIAKYALAILFLLTIHILMTPSMLLSNRKFFILTPASYIGKFASFYGKVEKPINIDLENSYNLIELDGNVVTVEESILNIKTVGHVLIVT